MKQRFKRVAAFLIDYVIIGIYASILFGVVMLFYQLSGEIPSTPGPVTGQIIDFFALTLPVFLYFFLSEASKRKATVGKRFLGITVETENGKTAIFRRNLLKFLPWEIAHTGVHWMVYYSDRDVEVPVWVLITVILPQVMIFIYGLSIFVTNGKRSLYDQLAKTEVHFSE